MSRALSDPRNVSCSSAPRKLTLTKVDRASVTLSWSPPRDEGGRADTAYRIYCRNCVPEVRFNPSTETFKLTPGTAYRVNGVSSVRNVRLRQKMNRLVFGHYGLMGPGCQH